MLTLHRHIVRRRSIGAEHDVGSEGEGVHFEPRASNGRHYGPL